MAEKSKDSSKLKLKKKIWYKIISPAVFGNKEVGESYLSEPETSLGRVVKANLKDLTGNPRDQNAYAIFKINKVSGTSLETEAIGYELTPAHVKRMVRKNTIRMDDFYTAKTKDGKRIIIKTFMISLKKTQRSKTAKLRKVLGEALREEASKSDFEMFIANLVGGKIQYSLRKLLHKIYPLRELAIKAVKFSKTSTDIAVPESEESSDEEIRKAETETMPEEAESVEMNIENEDEAEGSQLLDAEEA